ncbi:MAG: lactate racemase domain-containing protein [Planctomycetota bacterium]
MTPDLHVPWGNEELRFSIPADWTLLPLTEPPLPEAPSDWKLRLRAALGQPLAGPPLRNLLLATRSGRVCLVVEDLTRHSPLSDILEIVLKEVRQAGIADEQMEIVIASGMHPAMTEAQAREKLGPAVGGIPWRMNPWNDPSKYVEVGRAGAVRAMIDRGVADADVRILIASVSPHLQAGFGGGYKMFFPGCGELASIRSLHRTGIGRRGQRQLVGIEANPMRAVIDRTGQLIDARHGATFSVQYLLDGNDLPVSPTAGEPLAVHRRLARTCGEVCGFTQEAPADILITNAHPRDHDLWQCFKCIPNTCWAARPGGVVICLARCPTGLNEMKSMPWPLSPVWTRRLVRALGPGAICSILGPLVRRLAVDSQWFLLLATQLLARNPIFMVSPKLVADGVRFPGIGLYATVEQALVAAGTLLGGGRHRVSVCPAGGGSFPRGPD